MYAFKDPWVLAFLLSLPIFVFTVKKRKAVSSTVTFSSQDLVGETKATLKMRLSRNLVFLRAMALGLFIVALARPQSVLEDVKAVSEGVDIVVALDTSTSMLAEDFKVGTKRVNRYEVVRDVVKEFIKKRKDDRIAIVAFAARAYTACPLTTDYNWLYENLDRVRVGMIEDATAIGSAIASSLNRLRTSKTKSKIIILLTDGISNAGNISPIVAAEAAGALKVKVYTIGVGTKGLVPYPFKDEYERVVYQNIPIEIDEEVLRKISEITGGKYYRAMDTETLGRIYNEIDKLEKSNIERFGYKEYEELFGYFLIPGLIILLLEILLTNTIFLKIP